MPNTNKFGGLGRLLKFVSLMIFVKLQNGIEVVVGNENNNINNDMQTNNMPNFGRKSGSLSAITSYQFPQFREVSPCPCDVSINKCDIGCCCDAECQDIGNQNVTCMEGTSILLLFI